MLSRIKDILRDNKEDIKSALLICLLSIIVVLVIFIIILKTKSNDLVNRIQEQELIIQSQDYDMQVMKNDLIYQSVLIEAFYERDEMCRNGEDVGDSEFSIICIQK